MSQENLEIVREALRHLNENAEPKWDLYDDELVWVTRGDGPTRSTYQGLDGLRTGTASFRRVWAEMRAEIIDLASGDDVVVTELRWHLRAQSGVELEVTEGWGIWLRDGKITRIEQHPTRKQALEAAGLSEWAMSQENVEVLRRSIEAFNRGDPDVWVAVLAPEFEYTASGAVVGVAGTYRGADGFRRFLESFWDEFDEPKAELGELIAEGDQVLASVTFTGRGKHSGATTSLDLWQLWTLRYGKAVRGQAFTTRADALEAAGLSE